MSLSSRCSPFKPHFAKSRHELPSLLVHVPSTSPHNSVFRVESTEAMSSLGSVIDQQMFFLLKYILCAPVCSSYKDMSPAHD